MEIETLNIASHQTRFKILTELSKAPSYSSALARTLKIERKVIIFHLTALIQHGLITGEFALKPTRTKPTAVKMFHLTPSGVHVLGKVKHALEE